MLLREHAGGISLRKLGGWGEDCTPREGVYADEV